ncbi:hypothetical protein SAMN05216227_102029 [Pseudorhodobacter antarcticus]|uniref:Uncharacterized protein n=1 Tax=Pseudorhodobacter antarcticus TaxID=1077947 RepID=A0A1H8IG97_9RHOB|nr:hypothetical protein [Pseudorhodobacter antarcticus]SEN67391.1 hypothetical protein SAMN05216227_102029 [Pseudorhodobacter antarcticus]
MKYSLSLDCAITVVVWAVMGFSFFGLMWACIIGMVFSIKIASIWAWYKTPVADPRAVYGEQF